MRTSRSPVGQKVPSPFKGEGQDEGWSAVLTAKHQPSPQSSPLKGEEGLSKPVRLGSLTLAHNVILSPMVGVTDAPFRRLCARGGSALLSGEMLSAQAIKFNNAKTLHLLTFFPDERPL